MIESELDREILITKYYLGGLLDLKELGADVIPEMELYIKSFELDEEYEICNGISRAINKFNQIQENNERLI